MIITQKHLRTIFDGIKETAYKLGYEQGFTHGKEIGIKEGQQMEAQKIADHFGIKLE